MRTLHISDGAKLYRLLNKKIGKPTGSGWRCPFCREMGVPDSEQEDRFFLHVNTRSDSPTEGHNLLRFGCRHAKDYTKYEHPSVIDIVALFDTLFQISLVLQDTTWSKVDIEFRSAGDLSTGRRRKLTDKRNIWNDEQVVEMWMNGAQKWIDTVGITRATVNHFQLGVDPKSGRLSIPVPATPGAYLRRTRHPYADKVEAQAHGVTTYYLHPKGAPPLLWINSVSRTQPAPFCTIVEGDTSLFAADTLGLVPSAAGLGGAMTWYDSWSDKLYDRGYTRFAIIGDNDSEGEQYRDNIIESLLRVGEERQIVPTIRVMHWPETADPGADPRHVLKMGVAAGREYIDRHLGWVNEDEYQENDRHRRRPEFDAAYAANGYRADMEMAIAECVDLEYLRGGEDYKGGQFYTEIDRFVRTYRPSKDDPDKRDILLLRTPPGSGKTYMVVKYIQEFARKQLERTERRIAKERQRLERFGEKRTEAQEKRYEDIVAGRYKRLSVVFIGLYKDAWNTITSHPDFDSNLWHNVEGRNADNCKNLDQVGEVVARGYSPMHTLCIKEGICDYRHDCPFMRQRDEADQYPIAFLRHQHLRGKTLLEGAKLIVIDEDPGHVFLTPLVISPSDILFFDPSLVVDDSRGRDRLMDFNNLLRDSLQLLGSKFIGGDERGALYTGVEIVEAMEELVLRHGEKYGARSKTLRQIALHLLNVPLAEFRTWRPRDKKELYEAPRGQMAQFLSILAGEIVADANATGDGFNSRVSVQLAGNRSFEILAFPLEVFNIPAKRPVVCLDATGTELKYRLAFNARVRSVEFNVRNPACVTTTITGKEYAMSVLAPRNLRQRSHEKQYAEDRFLPKIRTEFSDEKLGVFDLDRHEFPHLVFREVVESLMVVAAKHNGCLFVTYKATRIWVEEFLKENFPAYYDVISFGHFGGLRGLNVFEKENAVLVAGTPRPNVATVRAQLCALFHADTEALTPGTVRTPTQYHFLPYWYSTLLPSDPRTHDLVYEMEAGEIEQCVERIRPHTSSGPQYVYLMTNRPACRWTGQWSEEDQIYKDRFFKFSEFRQVHAPLTYPELTLQAYNSADLSVRKLSNQLDVSQRKAEFLWQAAVALRQGHNSIDPETVAAGRRILKLDKQ